MQVVPYFYIIFKCLKKVLILCAHRPGRSPSQRYRFEQYIPFLEKNGYQFEYSFLLNEKDDKTFYSSGNFSAKIQILLKSVFIRLKDSRRFKEFDIIFIQREATFLGTSFFEKKAYRSGAKVIFDFDDSIWIADTSPGNKKWEWIKKPAKFFENIKNAHVVIAGNDYLAEKARPLNKNVIVIPTTVDTDIHVPLPEARGKNQLVIGWSGSISTIKHFELVIPVLKKLKEKHGEKIRFKVLGPSHYTSPEIEIESRAWTAETEVQDLNTFDIGIMPLPDDEWAKGKCGLKGLTYMACGIPTIMSNVGVNNSIIQHGENGFLASGDASWLTLLDTLIKEPAVRSRFSEKGRQTVIQKYSVQALQNKYLDLFNRSIKNKE
jgi:glycosyltransferase involved in cell wall biosynthesis